MKRHLNEFVILVFAPLPMLLALAITALLVISGPFESLIQTTVVERILYWGGVVYSGLFIAYALRLVVENIRPNLTSRLSGLVTSLLFSLVFTPILDGIGHLVLAESYLHTIPLSWTGGIVFLICVCIVQIRYFLLGGVVVAPDAPVPSPKNQRPRLFARLSSPDVSRLFRVSGRNHYIDVVTDKGVETLLMRFSDAISELDDIDGMIVHRSHWVARDAIAALDRVDGKVVVRLTNGCHVPVSRSHRPAIEAVLN
jgi:hypothetical protein